MKAGTVIAILTLSLSFAGCGGTKMLKEPQPVTTTQPLATASDQHLAVSLDWVIVRDGPGTWAKNVDWDEYLMRVQNLSGEAIQLTKITITDSLGTQIESRGSRKLLVAGTKDAKRRYKGAGLEVKAGAGVGTLLAYGAVAGATTAAIVGASVVGMSTGGAVVASGGLLLVPVLAVGGLMRGVNNGKVDDQIVSRQTSLPLVLQKDEETSLDRFFPLTPSPRLIELTYVDSHGEHTLIVDTQGPLGALHLSNDSQ